MAIKRLGPNVQVKLVSKVGKDAYGLEVQKEFEREQIDLTTLLCDPNDSTPFTYVIVNQQNGSRTCIHHPLASQLSEQNFEDSWLTSSSNNNVDLLFIDSRHHEAALAAANVARQRNIPILLDLEKIRLVKFIHCSFISNLALDLEWKICYVLVLC